MSNWHIVCFSEGLQNCAKMPVLHHALRTQAKAFACLLPGSSKGAVMRDGGNDLAIHFVVTTTETNFLT